MTSCNQIVSFDGEIVKNLKDIRESSVAHMALNMWNMNFFTTPADPASLILSLDMHFVQPHVSKIINAPNCVQVDAESKNVEIGNI